jgi:uncharacterized protein YaaQ
VVGVGVGVPIFGPGGEATTALLSALERRARGRQRGTGPVAPFTETVERVGDERPEVAGGGEVVDPDSVGVGSGPAVGCRRRERVEYSRLQISEQRVASAGGFARHGAVEILEGLGGSVENRGEWLVHGEAPESVVGLLVEHVPGGLGGLEE